MTPGQVVLSKNGRDKGRYFVVLAEEDGYVLLADGETRTLAKPKKKKIKHVQSVRITADLTIFDQRGLQDADIRKLLRPVKEVSSIVKGRCH